MMKNRNWKEVMAAALFMGLVGCSGSGPSDTSVKHDLSERMQERTYGVLDAEVKVLKREVSDENRVDVWVEEVAVRTSRHPDPRDLAMMQLNQQLTGVPMFQFAMLPAGTQIPGLHHAIVRYRRAGEGWVIESIRSAGP